MLLLHGWAADNSKSQELLRALSSLQALPPLIVCAIKKHVFHAATQLADSGAAKIRRARARSPSPPTVRDTNFNTTYLPLC